MTFWYHESTFWISVSYASVEIPPNAFPVAANDETFVQEPYVRDLNFCEDRFLKRSNTMEISSFTLALLRSRFKWRRRWKSKFRKFETTTIPPQCLMVFLNSWWKSSWTSDPVDFTGNAFRKSSHTESFTQLRCENLFCCSILTSGIQYWSLLH